MSSKPEPVIWSRDTSQCIACFDSCQLTITRIPKIKDVAMVMVLLLFVKILVYGRMDSHMTTTFF